MKSATCCALVFTAVGMTLASTHPGSEPPAPGETTVAVNRLTEENARLREENAQMRDLLKKLLDEQHATRQDVANLREDLATLKLLVQSLIPKPPVASGTQATPVPKDPLASPISMLWELKRKYAAEFPTSTGSSELAQKQRRDDVQKWCRDMTRLMRGKATWLVRMEGLTLPVQPVTAPGSSASPPAPSNAPPMVRYRVLDPITRLAIGDEIKEPAPARFVHRLRDLKPGTLVELGVLIAPEVKFNPDRAERGVFDVPPFVGPQVELLVKVEWQSIEPVKDSGPEHATDVERSR